MFRAGIIYVMFANYNHKSFGHNIYQICQPHLCVVWATFISYFLGIFQALFQCHKF
jgi:hypothetical protein